MAGRLSHTVGATDGQEGYFLLGWAKAYGDLRIFSFLRTTCLASTIAGRLVLFLK